MEKREFDQEDFIAKYRQHLGPNQDFLRSPYYAEFLSLLEDECMCKNIERNNDFLQIAPLKSFFAFKREVFSQKMTEDERKGIGACFGYYFRFMLNEGYRSKSSRFGDTITGMATAAIFVKE